MISVVHRLDAHGVFKHDAVGGDPSSAVRNEAAGDADPVELIVFLRRHTAAVHSHIVAPAHLLQLREVRDDRGLLAGEGQVDEGADIPILSCCGHALELCQFLIGETVQAAGQEVQLVNIDHIAFQHIQRRRRIQDLIQIAVMASHAADLHRLQQLDALSVFLVRDRQRNRCAAEFRAVTITQYSSHCIASFYIFAFVDWNRKKPESSVWFH